jgi:DNA repair protein RecO (recombination protein O)
MIEVVQAIVIHSVPHKDSSRIVYVLSGNDQIITLYASGFGKKRSPKAAIYYPGNHIELEVVKNHITTLLKAKEANIIKPWQTLQSDFYKSTVLTFILECLMVYIKQGQTSSGLYDTVLNYLYILDNEDIDYANMPIVFLLKLSQYLGIYPENGEGYFNIREGKFEERKHSSYGMERKESSKLACLLVLKPSDQLKERMGNNQRRSLIKHYLEFLDFHVDSHMKVLSLDILSTVLND